MLIPAFTFLVFLLFTSERYEAPIKVFAIAWLLCILPITFGTIRYTYFSSADLIFDFLLTGFLACFAFGVFCQHMLHKKSITDTNIPEQSQKAIINLWAVFAWLCGMIGTAFLCFDFFQRGGAGLDDIAALRELYIGQESSLFARIGSILTWGCLYSFAFALIYQNDLKKHKFYIFLLPVTGYFFVALFSAGRQSAMQILIFSLLILFVRKKISTRPTVNTTKTRRNRHTRLIPLLVSILMVLYMGYIAVARNDGAISSDKSEVLSKLFSFTLSEKLDWLLSHTPPGIRNTIIEALVYFTSPIPLFSRFLQADKIDLTYGALSLPFVMRQLEPITTLSVKDALDTKISMMASMDVIPVGWTTAISGYIQDFGFFLACLFIFFQGFYTSWAWWKMRKSRNFHDILVVLVLIMSVIYMPLISVFSDTNIFLLWAYCVAALTFTRRQKKWRPKTTASLHHS